MTGTVDAWILPLEMLSNLLSSPDSAEATVTALLWLVREPVDPGFLSRAARLPDAEVRAVLAAHESCLRWYGDRVDLWGHLKIWWFGDHPGIQRLLRQNARRLAGPLAELCIDWDQLTVYHLRHGLEHLRHANRRVYRVRCCDEEFVKRLWGQIRLDILAGDIETAFVTAMTWLEAEPSEPSVGDLFQKQLNAIGDSLGELPERLALQLEFLCDDHLRRIVGQSCEVPDHASAVRSAFDDAIVSPFPDWVQLQRAAGDYIRWLARKCQDTKVTSVCEQVVADTGSLQRGTAAQRCISSAFEAMSLAYVHLGEFDKAYDASQNILVNTSIGHRFLDLVRVRRREAFLDLVSTHKQVDWSSQYWLPLPWCYQAAFLAKARDAILLREAGIGVHPHSAQYLRQLRALANSGYLVPPERHIKIDTQQRVRQLRSPAPIEMAKRARSIAQETKGVPNLGSLARLRKELRRLEPARESPGEPVRLFDIQYIAIQVQKAKTEAESGRLPAAIRRLQHVLSYCHRCDDEVGLGYSYVDASNHLMWYYERSGRHLQGVKWGHRALERMRRLTSPSPERLTYFLEILARHHLAVGEGEDARALLDEVEEPINLERIGTWLDAYRQRPTPSVVDRLYGVAAQDSSLHTRSVLALMLHSLGQHDQACDLVTGLHTSPYFLRPTATASGNALHHIYGFKPIDRVELLPCHAGPLSSSQRESLELELHRLRQFHACEFPGSGLTILPLKELQPRNLSIQRLWYSHDTQYRLTRTWGHLGTSRQYVLISLPAARQERPLGLSSRRFMVVQFPYVATDLTLIPHEFYHSLLGLQHTDGSQDIYDEFSIMWHTTVPNYIEPGQKTSCVTAPALNRRSRHAISVWRKKGPQAALHLLEEALRDGPHQRGLYSLLADLFWELNQPERAFEVLESAQLRFGGRVWIRAMAYRHLMFGDVQLGRALLADSPAEEAASILFSAELYREFVTLMPTQPESTVRRALGWLHLGRWQTARNILVRFLRRDPESGLAYLLAAVCSAGLGDIVSYRTFLTKARRCGTTRSNWSTHLAHAEWLQGHWSAAAERLYRLCRKGKRGPWLQRAWCLWAAGDEPGARTAFHEAADGHGLHHPLGKLAQCWIDWLDGRRDLLPRLRDVLRRHPHQVEALHLMCIVRPSLAIQNRFKRLCPSWQMLPPSGAIAPGCGG